MKAFLKWIGVLVLAGIMACSCSKLGSGYDGTEWFVKMNPMGSLTVTFEDDAQVAWVSVNPGYDAIVCGLKVEWLSGNSFNLRFTEDHEPSYSGVINGDTMLLDELRFGEKTTYELKKKTSASEGHI
ncbi:MAG: hypothetical protein J5646_07850 [Bacteroidales bacterium]|nr:hypothetical protein [Bacteroidales bacterium]MBR4740179.1 hypothetical protein [Bacteroidales bacterium]